MGGSMAKVSPSLEELLIPKAGIDKSPPQGDWDLASSHALRKRIDASMREFVSISSKKSFRGISKLKRVLGTATYEYLLDELAEAGKKFTAESLDLNGRKSGGQRKPEVQMLCYDVQEALTAAFGEETLVWQAADRMQQSFALVVSRIIAARVGKPLSAHLRDTLKKARDIERI
ncbi:hypothetical protein C6W92_17135 [Roseovarius sp. A46]|uniref:hypothetical protein n=1 Tax=Roseovarius sp. A46 TaxID=2109331 RepID=UPI0010139593|nr:hypothetical protein [Roseovarius sp. A46]RXV58079.1 hypothetical protein C6W92_17135 [Roseovarius sp. A46]